MLLRVLPHKGNEKTGTNVHPPACSGIFFLVHCIVCPDHRVGRYRHMWRRDYPMPQSLVEIAKELTLALIETESIPPEDMQETLQKTHATLSALKAQEEMGTTPTVPASRTAPVDWRTSITRYAIVCLECGQSLKQLSGRHLRTHGLDNRSYRTKYGIPRTQPLAARESTVRRRQVVQETRPWEKSPRFRKGQARDGSAAPEPDAVVVQEEADEPSAAAPAQPKRQRKTTSKKQTARTKRSAG